VEGFAFLTHPKVDKVQFEKTGLVQLKDANKGFPAQRPVGILKWTFEKSAGRSDDFIPIKINCWPEEEGRGRMNVSIEYSMVRIHIIIFSYMYIHRCLTPCLYFKHHQLII
jgi:hypothetical protein